MVVDNVADKVANMAAGMVVDKVIRGRWSGVRWVRGLVGPGGRPRSLGPTGP